ncbi:RimK-like ATP-grasp domain-containing protein [Parageobacillus thermantarcticus]|uniref:RimK-like ATP-grasp domain-containing protein n=1 Tax=Parageobacillus thermantarcticus TaxID=186116 RepID=A0A1I0TUS9_9BACL|nr:hypothetical protein [Parageobacillus thermantarcticus]SFA55353.1 RimK-like ATP-grasp domain-containing protein [Parageobacillus thermantarcticus]
MILILSDQYDVHADKVISELNQMNASYYRLNLDVESLCKTIITYDLDNNNWKINNGVSEINSSEISCVWLRRPFVELTLEEAHEQDVQFRIWKNEWNKTLLGLYLDLKNIKWMNNIQKTYQAENKYLQMKLARKIGFSFPKTLISNAKEEIIKFAEQNEKIVLKLMAQEFYKTEDQQYKGIYVNLVTLDDLQEFNLHSENPIVLQEYIEKKYEARYMYVGGEHFVCKIDSQKSSVANIDWRRYDIANTPHSVIEPPLEISEKVNQLMKELNLEYAALDFIIDPTDKWYFLEVNSMGQWLWIEDLTGLKISKSIAKWLVNNS